MEQVIFLHADEDSDETLSQMQHSLAQRLVLVAPARMDRLRLSLLLRLARRALTAQAREVYLVSEDRLAQLLATRMGFGVATTLDEYRGLTPGRAAPSSQRRRRPATRLTFAPGHPAPAPEEAAALAGRAAPPPNAPAPQPAEEEPAAPPQRPGANLEKMLVDGYLPNPAATPDLEEEAERAEREEHERLYYEIDEEQPPSRAQQAADRHEEQIIERIFKTSQSAPPTPDSDADDPPADALPGAPERPTHSAGDAPAPDLPDDPADRADDADLRPPDWEGRVRPMRAIDDLLRERGRGEVFEWFERRSAEAAEAAHPGDAPTTSAVKTASARVTTMVATADTPQRRRAAPALERPRPGNRAPPRPAGTVVWRRVSIIGALALSLLMTGFALALIPSAEVDYHAASSPYSASLLLDARPAGVPAQANAQPGTYAPAQIARFDGVLTGQAPATGLRPAPDAPDQLVAFPTASDADQLASRLEAQLQQWGTAALRAQAGQGDILGPMLSDEGMLVFPAVGASLPAGVSTFQLSVSLHLRATLIRRAALLQAARQELSQTVRQARPGFAPQAGQMPHLTILSTQPAGPGEQQLELLVRVQAAAMIGPDLTPEQIRTAIAGLAVPDAEAYLHRQPGISAVSISIQPKWLNRLPIFSARIRINLEN